MLLGALRLGYTVVWESSFRRDGVGGGGGV